MVSCLDFLRDDKTRPLTGIEKPGDEKISD